MIHLTKLKKILPIAVTCLFISACSNSESPSKVFVYKETDQNIKNQAANIKRVECHNNSSASTQNTFICNYETMNNKNGTLSITANFNDYTTNFNYIGLHQEEDGEFVLEAGDAKKPISNSYAKSQIGLLNESIEQISTKINQAVKLATPVFVREYRIHNNKLQPAENGELVISYYQFQVQQNGKTIHHFKDENTGQSLKIQLASLFTNSQPEIITVPTSVLKYIKIPQLSYKNKWIESSFTVDTRAVPIKGFNGVNIHDYTNLIYLKSIDKNAENNITVEQFETLKYGLDLNIDKITFVDTQIIKFEPKVSYTNIKLNIKDHEKHHVPNTKPELSQKEYNHSIELKAGQTSIVSLPTNEGIKRFLTFSLLAK